MKSPEKAKQLGKIEAYAQRVSKVKHFIETNDVESFRNLRLSRKECLNMRFHYDMNLLQLVCFEEANIVLDHLRHQF